MVTTEKVYTMDHVGVDDWDRPVYKCLETGVLWKDVELGKCNTPVLYSCGNVFDGEPSSPIKSDVVVIFKTKFVESPHRFNYMMLSRLQSDCEYFLGYGNRNKSRLCGGSVQEHIKKMKKIHDSFPDGEKPEWLTYDGILDYEHRMSE